MRNDAAIEPLTGTELSGKFREVFHTQPAVVARAPGRVNLIGEHTDYNDGFVLPVAIDKTIRVAASLRDDDRLAVYSEEYSALSESSLRTLKPRGDHHWANYVDGVAFYLQQHGTQLRGVNLYIASDIPRGAGLSSSAALEVGVALALLSVNHAEIPKLDIINLCRQAEHNFAGVLCGIMDQFVCTLGRQQFALFLDCRTLDYERVPFPRYARLVVCNTGVRHELASSEYNRRRSDCAMGVEILSRTFSQLKSLRDASVPQLEKAGQAMPMDVYKRCRHVITENERVVQSVEALKHEDLDRLGTLMKASHKSLKEDYEVSCDELDAVVDSCADIEGIYGARMTGGGFGGCAICIAREERADEAVSQLEKEYLRRTGRKLTTYVCAIVDGATAAKTRL